MALGRELSWAGLGQRRDLGWPGEDTGGGSPVISPEPAPAARADKPGVQGVPVAALGLWARCHPVPGARGTQSPEKEGTAPELCSQNQIGMWVPSRTQQPL